MNIPLCTYRLQLSPGFGFDRCAAVTPYLAALGVSHIYASPIFKARPGSSHGYDVCDPTALNPELLSEEQEGQDPQDAFLECITKVHGQGLGWLQDIVPNHMAVTGSNPFLVDLLENGEASRYYSFFDIDWQHPLESIHGRMLAPFLGGFYGDTLERGEITLGFDQDGFFVSYYELRFPVRLDSYARILTHGIDRLRDKLGREDPDYVKLLGILYTIKGLPQEEPLQERYYQISFIKRMLHELFEHSEQVREFINENLAAFNGQDDAEGKDFGHRYDLINTLLSEQSFRLSYWKVAGEEINYRRFFSINDLISLRVEEENVFEETHSLILDYAARGIFSGLRVDHIDGLYDPSVYCKRLREHAPEAYIVVEKILMHEEPLPSFWPIQGTTGYEFAAAACGLFVPRENEAAFDTIYTGFTGHKRSLSSLVGRNKRKIIDRHMAGDVENLARLVNRVSSHDRRGFDITLLSLKRAITELMINFPVYRTYVSFDAFRPADLTYIRSAIRLTRRKNPELSSELDFLERFLILDFDENILEEDRRLWIQFVMRFQQFTGPLMAKGVEDTTLYVMNRLLCLNEVGSDPSLFGVSPQDVHAFLQERGKLWPHCMNATATHDTKRGEDARLRLAALAELPKEFQAALQRFRRINARRRASSSGGKGDGKTAPTPNDEYFLYQTLLATWPASHSPSEPRGDCPEMAQYPERIRDYMVKALREGKENSGWITPDLEYEEAVLGFVDKLLKPGKNAFLREFAPLQQKCATLGMLYSLGQTLLKFTAPGVPDLYQGAELWDLSLVDPDNRRPVNFDARERALQDMTAAYAHSPQEVLRELLKNPADGRVKLFTIWRCLQARRDHPLLFRHGDYHPLAFQGPRSEQLFGFVRTFEGEMLLTLCPRNVAPLHNDVFPLTPAWAEYWRDNTVTLPFPHAGLKSMLLEQLLPEREPDAPLSVEELFTYFPVGLYCGKSAS